MTISNIKEQQFEVEKALTENRIKDALTILGALIKTHHSGSLSDDIYNLVFTYKSMLKYTIEGITDPDREKVYNNIITSCYQLSDTLFTSIHNIQSNGVFYETRRNIKTSSSENIVQSIDKLYSDFSQKQMAEQAGIHSGE